MENKGLLFIPDISGFTRFINETEINHSRLIIQELLELLISTNQLGLEISEIEGDAILFYRFGASPGLEEIYRQVEKMFCTFHSQLMAYEYRRFCQCSACRSAIHLTLKVITHYGEFTGYQVKNFEKLIGKDVIVAHQLLKNDIAEHEYWLVTPELLPQDPPPGFAHWMEWNSSRKQTDNGEIDFRFTHLGPLKKDVQAEPIPRLQLSRKRKTVSLSQVMETDIITLFHATGDFAHRHRWKQGVKAVEEVSHFLPRIGTRCRCILENGTSSIYASSYSFSPEKIEFSETNEKDNSTTYYTLEKTAENQTRLTVDFYIPKNFFSETIYNLTRKGKTEQELKQSLQNLEGFVKEIRLTEDAAVR